MRSEHLDDGSRLEAAWHDALSTSLSYFRALLASSSSPAWKPVQVLPLSPSSVARDTGQSKAKDVSLGRITANQVAVHRRSGKTGEVYRAVVEVECGPEVSVDTFRGCLATPETRPLWDRMVQEATTLDLLDANTRVTQTSYRLGWPSSPRDAVTISKTLVDQHTLIDISTSVPRSRHEPAYLRPSPPFVRAHVALLAWCIQLPNGGTAGDGAPPEEKARITCMWSWNPKGAWAVGGGVPQHLPSVVVGLVDHVREGSEKVPVLLGYSQDVSIGSVSYDATRVTISVGYSVLSADEAASAESRRQLEFGVSSSQGWDIQVHVRTQHGDDSPSSAWTAFVGQAPPTHLGRPAPKRLIIRFSHAAVQPGEELVRARISIERTVASSGVRINGVPVAVEPMTPPAPKRPLLEETASTSGLSLHTMSTADSFRRDSASDIRQPDSDRTQAAEKSIASIIKRNYIYFTSLLQEPEPKWRPVMDSRGVAVHQLNSIDKTLVVFRAEAVFVGVGIWDLFATIMSPGGRLVWDKSHDEAVLLEDVNELTDLWHFRSKAAWPVAARDSVMLRTTYKSPSSVHIFGFSTDDTDLFPRIPPSIDPTIIRTQIDLQGWSIESLSPNTTQVTLLEQSDPRGWSNKSSIPQVMMTTLAGMGEFAIKHGAPPAATRLGGAKALFSRYDVEKESFRFEYESAERRSHSSSTATAFPLPVAIRTDDDEPPPTYQDSNVECEIRCDCDKWSNSLIMTIDPPPLTISALKRHRLSPSGGGLWLTIEHDPDTLGSDKVVVNIRRGTTLPGAKTTVTANGSKIKVDVEDLSESDVQLLKKQKRSKPTRVPLDVPPALGTLRKKQSTIDLGASPVQGGYDPFRAITPTTLTRFTVPLARLYNSAAETTRAAIVPMASPSPAPESGSTPVDAAVRALSQLARIHADRESESTDPFGWQPVSDKDGIKVEKRIVSHVSESFPVFRAGRIIEGFTAEEVSAAVSALRKDERFEKPTRLQSYGHGIITSHMVAATAFPFRPRSILLSTAVARVPDGPPPSPSTTSHAPQSTIFHASSSSFDPHTLDFDPAKYNPAQFPSGNVILEGWIIETIDPYSHEQYAIPSTRCMYLGAIDYSGSMPLSVNNMLNASLPRVLLTIDQSLKFIGPPSRVRLPPMMVMTPDANAQCPWALEGVDEQKLGVEEKNDGIDYSLSVMLHPTGSSSRSDDALAPPLKHSDSRTSVNTGRSTVIDLAEEIRGGKKDLVVMEIEVGSSLSCVGGDIMVRAVSLPVAQHTTTGPPVLPLTLPAQDLSLPFRCQMISLAPSMLQAASLDPAQTRHLLRITLPTSGYEPTIADPLTGSQASLSPRPRWLLDLINDGAVVELKMRSRAPDASSAPPKYTCNQEDLIPEDEKRSRTVSGTVARNRVPQLVSDTTPRSASLAKALAVAEDLMRAAPAPTLAPAASITAPNGTHQDDKPAGQDEQKPLSEEETRSTIEPPPRPPLVDSAARYSFWQYSRFPRFRSSTTPSVGASPATAPTPLATDAAEGQDGAAKSTGDVPDAAPTDNSSAANGNKVAIGSGLMGIRTGSGSGVPLPTAIALCLLCLLLGSLFRSLLTEADFVVHVPHGVQLPEKAAKLRDLRRIFEFRLGWNLNLILAIARRA